MLNRPRPALQLFAFLSGGYAMGITVGLVVLFIFRRTLPGSADFALPKVQILVGFFALLIAVIVAVDLPARVGSRAARMATATRRLLSGHSLFVAGKAGLGIALPSVDYVAALAVIFASGATVLTQLAGC